MADAGWVDRASEDLRLAHPFLDQLTHGSLDIAGHVMQRCLADDATARLDPPDPLLARARAGAVFAAWVADMSVVQASRDGTELPAGASGNELGLQILRHLTGGDL